MRRREFIALLGGTAMALSCEAISQQSPKVWRIAYLSNAANFTPVDKLFEKSLEQLGWTRDRNIKIEYWYTGGRPDKVAPVVAEAVGSSPDLLVVWSDALGLATMQMAPQTPIVFLTTNDAIAVGFVSNLARPAGDVTGISSAGQLVGKRLELLKEAVPSLTQVVVLFSTQETVSGRDALRSSAKALSIKLDEIVVAEPADLETAILGAKSRGAQALLVWGSGFAYSYAQQICDVVNANALPSSYPFKEGTLSGCLFAYGADLKEWARHGAAYVDKILRGTQPGSLPVEQMSKYELTINLKTAKMLGLTLPPNLLALANEVIE